MFMYLYRKKKEKLCNLYSEMATHPKHITRRHILFSFQGHGRQFNHMQIKNKNDFIKILLKIHT